MTSVFPPQIRFPPFQKVIWDNQDIGLDLGIMSLPPGLHAELMLHQDVQTLDDEWSGITDPVIRRKLQNRLNQRAARALLVSEV